MWVSWAIPAVPISSPTRHPPTRTIISVTGFTPSILYLRVFVSWTREESLSRRGWTLRLVASTPGRSSSFRSWNVTLYLARRTPTTSSTTYTSTSITRPCRTRYVLLWITRVRIIKSNRSIVLKIVKKKNIVRNTTLSILILKIAELFINLYALVNVLDINDKFSFLPGAYGKCKYRYSGKNSEGNRFISNNDL